jgi:hypothetical protein
MELKAIDGFTAIACRYIATIIALAVVLRHWMS